MKSKRKERKALEPRQRAKKALEHQINCGNSYIWCAWNGFQRFGKGPGKVGNQRKNRDYPNYNSVKFIQILRRVLDT